MAMNFIAGKRNAYEYTQIYYKRMKENYVQSIFCKRKISINSSKSKI